MEQNFAAGNDWAVQESMVAEMRLSSITWKSGVRQWHRRATWTRIHLLGGSISYVTDKVWVVRWMT